MSPMTDDQIREAIRWARFSPEERKAAARSDGHIIGVDYHTQKALDVLADEVERHDVLLCDVAQLLDGWHADGTAWTEHDESIRQRVSAAQWKLASVAPAKPRHCCGLTGFNPMKGDSCPACEKDGPK